MRLDGRRESSNVDDRRRMKWLKLGLTTGDISHANKIFQLPESEL